MGDLPIVKNRVLELVSKVSWPLTSSGWGPDEDIPVKGADAGWRAIGATVGRGFEGMTRTTPLVLGVAVLVEG